MFNLLQNTNLKLFFKVNLLIYIFNQKTFKLFKNQHNFLLLVSTPFKIKLTSLSQQ